MNAEWKARAMIIQNKPQNSERSDATKLVGTARFELATPCTPCKCATRLRHVPTRLFFFDSISGSSSLRSWGGRVRANDTLI